MILFHFDAMPVNLFDLEPWSRFCSNCAYVFFHSIWGISVFLTIHTTGVSVCGICCLLESNPLQGNGKLHFCIVGIPRMENKSWFECLALEKNRINPLDFLDYFRTYYVRVGTDQVTCNGFTRSQPHHMLSYTWLFSSISCRLNEV